MIFDDRLFGFRLNMEKDKSRGLKHMKNKQKYKGNSNKKIEHVPTKSRSAVLDSNWDRYEGIDEEFTESQERIDFSTLATAPIGQGKHFQFRSDKVLAEEVENENNRELFHLDLKKLQKNIETIPFYERLNIPKHVFSEQQIMMMDLEAEENFKEVERKYKQKINKNTVDMSVKVEECAEKIEKYSVGKTVQQDIQSIPTNPDDDLEKWLDDILDE